MQAIRTRYLPATNTKPSRMQAKCEARTITVSYNYDLDGAGNHREVCENLRLKMGWDNIKSNLAGGVFAGDYYWVFV